jgi:hypothetical protein
VTGRQGQLTTREPGDKAVGRVADLVARVEQRIGLSARLTRADGAVVEGHLVDVGASGLVMFDDATQKEVEVYAHDVESLDVDVPRRVREWLVAVIAIPAATMALVGFAMLPGVRPDRGDIVVGFIILALLIEGAISIPFVRNLWKPWFSNWRRIYPPVDE